MPSIITKLRARLAGKKVISKKNQEASASYPQPGAANKKKNSPVTELDPELLRQPDVALNEASCAAPRKNQTPAACALRNAEVSGSGSSHEHAAAIAPSDISSNSKRSLRTAHMTSDDNYWRALSPASRLNATCGSNGLNDTARLSIPSAATSPQKGGAPGSRATSPAAAVVGVSPAARAARTGRAQHRRFVSSTETCPMRGTPLDTRPRGPLSFRREQLEEALASARPMPAYPPAMFDIIFQHAESYQIRHEAEQPTRLLDLACGSLGVIACIGERFTDSIGVDMSYDQLKKARELHPTATFVHGAADNFTLVGNNNMHRESVDVATIGSSLHLLNAGTVLAHVAPLLRPKGILAAFTPYFELRGPHRRVQEELEAFLMHEGCDGGDDNMHRRTQNREQLPHLQSQYHAIQLVGTFEHRVKFEDADVQDVVRAFAKYSAVQAYSIKYPHAAGTPLKYPTRASGCSASDTAAQIATPRFEPGCDIMAVFAARLQAKGSAVSSGLRIPIHILRKTRSTYVAPEAMSDPF